MGARDHLAEAQQSAAYLDSHAAGSAGSPDQRTIGYALAGILDALLAIAERMPTPSRGDETTPGVGRGGEEGDDA